MGNRRKIEGEQMENKYFVGIDFERGVEEEQKYI